MARTKGSTNRINPDDPRYIKTTRKNSRIVSMSIEERTALKFKMLEKLANGEANTITEAAILCEVKPALVYNWAVADPEFKDALAATKQVLADNLEKQLAGINNFIPKMFLLKAIRPEYRDNARFGSTDSKMNELLEELKRLGGNSVKITTAPEAARLPAPKEQPIEGTFTEIKQAMEEK